jgi:hypothetical protein
MPASAKVYLDESIPKRMGRGELAGLIALSGLVVFFVVTSWRKWPDPLVDFGRELYLPWRIANGAVLYRDVDDLYGPLSQYLNAALFRCFGPGLMVLVTANLTVFTAILGLVYWLCRRAWGVGSAFVSSALFVSIFGFSQFVVYGNYNYATPYSHEATHGLLICLILVMILMRENKGHSVPRSFAAGLLFGLTAILKVEIMLPAGLITLVAGLIQWRKRKSIRSSAIAAWVAGAMLPTLAFILYFAACMPWREALRAPCTAWLNAITTSRFIREPQEAAFLGTEDPWKHLLEHTTATLIACGLIAVIAGTAWLVERIKDRETQVVLGALLVASLSCLSVWEVNWRESGECLLGLMLIYLCFSVAPFIRKPALEMLDETRILRLLMAVLAAGLMARMILRGRIYQYGFYQAALAALVVPAVLIGELPARLGMGRWGQTIITLGTLSLLVPGVAILAGESQQIFRVKTLAVGQGVDQFYAFPPDRDPTGQIVRLVIESLRNAPHGQTLLVLPDGVIINYLSRMPIPVSPYSFFGAATFGGREESILSALRQRPPDWIAIVSRDLTDYGIQRYGEDIGNGRLILDWVNEHYDRSSSIGGDPLDPLQSGAVILKRKPG